MKPLNLTTEVRGWAVSTVALPIEHPHGAKYETGLAELIIDDEGPWSIHQRYTTREQAITGHIEVCDQIAAGHEVKYR